MKDTLRVLADTGEIERFKVMVGGGPVTPGWAEEFGAHGYGADSAQAVELAKRLVGGE
jgi:methanogenic corrinoid protein MtbC1